MLGGGQCPDVVLDQVDTRGGTVGDRLVRSRNVATDVSGHGGDLRHQLLHRSLQIDLVRVRRRLGEIPEPIVKEVAEPQEPLGCVGVVDLEPYDPAEQFAESLRLGR